jgi:predicted nucleotidyltransferase
VKGLENTISKEIIIFGKKRMQLIIEKRREDLKNICKALKIKRLYAFGSVVSDKFTEKSDIDFLISFSDNLTVDEYTNNYFSLHYRLKELFNREIDIVTERTLSNPYFIESINKTKELIYEA